MTPNRVIDFFVLKIERKKYHFMILSANISLRNQDRRTEVADDCRNYETAEMTFEMVFSMFNPVNETDFVRVCTICSDLDIDKFFTWSTNPVAENALLMTIALDSVLAAHSRFVLLEKIECLIPKLIEGIAKTGNMKLQISCCVSALKTVTSGRS
ncbi:MAG: hypothetical protein LBK29_04020 [Oscillospiraceae bacterium]|jgi:hypothetical protein|nr:hypothetical protein [Oscillospiraceae bacterium]